MKATELRIGNIVLLDDEEITLTGIKGNTVFWKDGFDMTGLTGAEIKPIPLTEEWLLKFGFKPIDERGYSKEIVNKKDNYEYNFVLSKVDDGYDNDVCLYTIKYVHQLQNLYFALTGKELIINN